MRLTLQQIARVLGGEVSGGQVRAPAPGHSANDLGMAVKIGRDGNPIVHLFNGGDPLAAKDIVCQKCGIEPFKPNDHAETARTISYDYRDASGEVRYRKKRIERADGTKTFAIEPKGRGGSAPLLYGAERLADLGEGQPVWIVEGEKCVDRLRELGAIAVSGDSGASSKWLPEHAGLLRGLPVILWPDSDDPGEKYIANAARALRKAESGADIRVVRPFGLPNGAKGRDVCDWTGDLAELAAGALHYAPLALGNGALPPEFTEDRLALEFAKNHADELRYVARWNRWLEWAGSRWRFDDTLNTYTLARKICRGAAARCNKPSISAAIAKAKTVAAVETMARADDLLKATVAQWDADPRLMNTPGVIYDIKTGVGRPAAPGDYCTKSTAVAPAIGDPVMFLGFLNKIMGGDKEMISYLWRVFGYCLTGLTIEHAMFFFHGTGANGKSVLLSTVSGILGDYHKTAPIETFTVQHGQGHPTDLAGLMGARLVTAIETEEGRRWAEAKIKALTGGDEISARFMRQDFFEFTPQFKLIVAGNHKPSLRTVDEAMKRRLHMVPFAVTIPKAERDKDLAEKLKAEWPQILNWMIEGCREWQDKGLAPPAAVIDATAAYFDAQDTIAAWIEDRCETNPNWREPRNALFLSWKDWAEKAGEFTGDQKTLFDKLECRGFRPHRSACGRSFTGIRLKQIGWE